MTAAAALRSGKSHREENFPVASRLLERQHRTPILAFYEFVRTADDVADHPTRAPAAKLALLDDLESSLRGERDDEPTGVALRSILADRGLSPRHALDLLKAFRLDVTKHRYADWEELMHYCRYSAMPVGRFVLDVHEEDRSTWPASDALCAALQIINHLQDCGDDYRRLDRVYLPLDMLSAHGAKVEHLAGDRLSPPLRHCVDEVCERVDALLRKSADLAASVRNWRLRLEISVIQEVAERLVEQIKENDPLAKRVELDLLDYASLTPLALLRGIRGSPTLLRGKDGTQKSENGEAAVSHSSFYAAMRILPSQQRRAMFDVYAFCRAVDDIADSQGPRPQRLAQLEGWRRDIARLYGPTPPEHLKDLADTARTFGLKREDFLTVIDGMEMDVAADIRAPDLGMLDLYCERVASAVGRLCTPIFGMSHDDGLKLSHHLGRALQLTNILRDLDEDASSGRLYLPDEVLKAHGIDTTVPQAVLRHPAVGGVCAVVAKSAVAQFDKADAVMAGSPRNVVRAPMIMASAYRSILKELMDRGWSAPRDEVHLGKTQVVGIVLRSFLW